MRLPTPVRIGLESAKANAVPMVVLWGAAVSLVAAYHFVPSVAAALGTLANWQSAHRLVGSMASRVVFCGLIPGVFLLCLTSIRPKRPVLTVLATTLWNVAWAVPFDGFFRLQAALFGEGNSFSTLLCKLSVDQFVWTVFLVAPANAVFFRWEGSDFSPASLRMADLCRDWRKVYLPNLIANWCIWIPVVLVIYAFPTDLQIHVSGLVGSFWILLCLALGNRAADVQ